MSMGPTDWREQIEAVIAGEAPQRIPAIFRLEYWYRARLHANDLPAELSGMDLPAIESFLGLVRSARDAQVCKSVLRPPVERFESRDGDRVITEWHTPRGVLRRVARYGPGDEAVGFDPTIIEHPIKCREDYAIYREVMRHTEFVPTYDDFRQYDRQIGRAGLPMVILGAIPFHELLIEWVGYEQGYLHLHDHPDVVLEAVDEAVSRYRRMWPIVAESPARLILHGVNFSTQMTPPPVWRTHFLPYLREFNREMHLAGKKVVFHADGDMSGLLELMVEAGFDASDCFACAPLVRCTVAEARAAWRDRITIWGALPAILLEPHVPLGELRRYLEDLYRTVAPGDRFMLGISDMVMPTTSWEHLKLVREWIARHSAYPIGAAFP